MPFPTTHPALAQALAERGLQRADRPSRPPSSTPARSSATCWSPPRPAPARPSPSAWRWPRRCSASAERFGPAGEPLALIVAPTRELALQVQRELDLALRPGRRARRRPASAAWTSAREQRALQHGAHIVVGTPGRLRDHLERGRLDTLGAARRRARRGRRDARPRLPRGPRVHPRRDAGRAPHAAVLGHHRQARSRPWPRRYQRDAAAHRHRAARPSRTATSSTGPCASRPTTSSTPSSTCCAIRGAGRAGVLRHPRGGAPPARQPAASAASPPWPSPAR